MVDQLGRAALSTNTRPATTKVRELAEPQNYCAERGRHFSKSIQSRHEGQMHMHAFHAEEGCHQREANCVFDDLRILGLRVGTPPPSVTL